MASRHRDTVGYATDFAALRPILSDKLCISPLLYLERYDTASYKGISFGPLAPREVHVNAA